MSANSWKQITETWDEDCKISIPPHASQGFDKETLQPPDLIVTALSPVPGTE
jgi:hypothetical protein